MFLITYVIARLLWEIVDIDLTFFMHVGKASVRSSHFINVDVIIILEGKVFPLVHKSAIKNVFLGSILYKELIVR